MSTFKKIAAEAAFPFIIAVSTLSLYISTLLPGVSPDGDEAKFQFIGKILGVPHATGFPTYVLLNWLFVHLVPLKSIAWRANLMSAVFSSAACLMLYFLLLQLTGRRVLSFLTTLLFSVTYTFWSFSLVARHYSLNLFFFCIVIFLLIRWHDGRKDHQLYLALIIYSISLGNHPSSIFSLPAVVYMILVTDPKIVLDRKTLWVFLGMLIIAALLYSYVPVRYHQGAPYQEGNVATVSDFIRYISGDYFRKEMFDFSMRKIPQMLKCIFVDSLLKTQFYSPAVIALGIIGVLWSLWKRTKLGIFLLLTVILGITWTSVTDYGDIPPRYFIPEYLVFVTFFGLGIDGLLGLIRSARMRKAAYFIAVIYLIFNIGLVATRNYPLVDRSRDTEMQEIVEKTLRHVEDNAVILSGTYNYFEAFKYYFFIEEEGKDKNVRLLLINLGSPVKIIRVPHRNAWEISQTDLYYSEYIVPLDSPIYTLGKFPDLNLVKSLHISDTVDLYRVLPDGEQPGVNLKN